MPNIERILGSVGKAMEEAQMLQEAPEVLGAVQIGPPSSGDPQPRLITTDHDLLVDLEILDTSVYQMENLVDLRDAERWTFWIESTLDAAVEFEYVGGPVNTPDRAGGFAITAAVPANTNDIFGDAILPWAPFGGLRITPVSAPTSGRVSVKAYVQRRMVR